MLPSNFLEKLSCIDTQIGLKYLDNNYELYIKILNNFFLRYEQLDLFSLNQNEFKEGIHILKGLSATLGMTLLSELSSKLHDGKLKYVEACQMELEKVLKELAKGLNEKEESGSFQKILILNNNEIEIDMIIDILEDDYDLLIALDIEEAKEVMDQEEIDLLLASEFGKKDELDRFKEDVVFENLPLLRISKQSNMLNNDELIRLRDKITKII